MPSGKRPTHAAGASGNPAGFASPHDGSGQAAYGQRAGRTRYSEDGLEALGRQIDHQRTRPRPKTRRRRLRRTLLVIGGVVVVLIAAVAGYAYYLNSQIHRINVQHLTAAPAGANSGTQNILMVGSTSRCALKVQNPAYGLCSQGVTGVNSDVIMILHLNPAKRTLGILSIPRDLFVPNARTTGSYKIDAALAQGPSQLVNVIEQDFGIPIQHYVELNFDTFANVVNALGGINMYFPMPVYDAESGLNVPTAGCRHLDGYQALQVVRARHLQYKGPGVTSNNPANWPQETQSDLARIRRDHEFLRVLASAVSHKGLGNPLTDEHLVSSVAGDLTVDSGFSATDMVNLVLTYHGVNPQTAPQLTLPVKVGTFGTYYYKGNNEGDVEFPSYPQDRQAIDTVLGVDTHANTFSGGTLPAPSSVSVSVLNGTGAYNQATDTGQSLQALGFHLVGVGNTTPPAQESETYVTYANNSDIGAAEAVANSLTGSVILKKVPATTDGAQVTVVTGTNFSVNPPPSAAHASAGSSSSSATTAPASSSSSSSSSGASSNFTPATHSQNPLKPWDPRSCNAKGGPGA